MWNKLKNLALGAIFLLIFLCVVILMTFALIYDNFPMILASFFAIVFVANSALKRFEKIEKIEKLEKDLQNV